jgi:hypothetical protein
MTCGCRCHSLDAVPMRMDLDVYRGDTLELVMLMRDADGGLVDISGQTFAATIRASYDSVVAVPFAVGVDLAASVVTLSLTDTQTLLDVPRRGVWDWQRIVTATGDVTTLARGSVLACHDVTA